MVSVVCVDGSVLTLVPVPVVDREGAPYEATLRLERDGAPFGEVGQRCGGALALTAARLRESRLREGPEAFPATGADLVRQALDGAGTSAVVRRAMPRDPELLALRARDPDDVDSTGELRLWLRDERSWQSGAAAGHGRWSLRCRAVLDAWGTSGTGVRCLLDSGELLELLERLVDECAAMGAVDRHALVLPAPAVALGPDGAAPSRRARV